MRPRGWVIQYRNDIDQGNSGRSPKSSQPLEHGRHTYIENKQQTIVGILTMEANMRIEMEVKDIQVLAAAVAAAAMEILAPQLAAHLAAVSKAVTAGQARIQASTGAESSSTVSVGAEMINLSEVKRLTGLSESSIWRHERRLGTFPRRRQISTRRVAWVRSEVLAWVDDRQVA